eukprot:bmy_09851T0
MSPHLTKVLKNRSDPLVLGTKKLVQFQTKEINLFPSSTPVTLTILTLPIKITTSSVYKILVTANNLLQLFSCNHVLFANGTNGRAKQTQTLPLFKSFYITALVSNWIHYINSMVLTQLKCMRLITNFQT